MARTRDLPLAGACASNYAARMVPPASSITEDSLWGAGLSRLQKFLGRLSALFLLAGFFTLADGLAAEMRRGPNRLDMLPGAVAPLSGPIPVKQAERSDFFVQGDSPDGQVRLELDDYFAGHWFGSGMWRGRVVVGDNPGMGEHPFIVEFRGAPPKAAQTFRVVVWPDAQSMRMESFSWVTRKSGLPSFPTAAALLAGGLLGGLGNFLAGRRRQGMLLRQGCAEIYKVLRSKDGGLEASFALGTDQGVRVGQECEILRPDGMPALRTAAAFCEPRHASLLLPPDAEVRPGWIVRPLPRDAASRSSAERSATVSHAWPRASGIVGPRTSESPLLRRPRPVDETPPSQGDVHE